MTPEGPETATTPAIPAQRVPADPPMTTEGEGTPAGERAPLGAEEAGGGGFSTGVGEASSGGVATGWEEASSAGDAVGRGVATGGGEATGEQASPIEIAPPGHEYLTEATAPTHDAPPAEQVRLTEQGWPAEQVRPAEQVWLADQVPPAAWGYADGGPAVEQTGTVRGRRRTRVLLLAGGTALAVLVAGLVILGPEDRPDSAAVAAPSGPPAPSAPATPYDLAVAALEAQAAALLRGDEGAWLSAVDSGRSALRTRYRNMFRSLRALGVSRFEYEAGLGQEGEKGIAIPVDAFFCFGPEMCPDNAGSDWQKPPHISQKLTLRVVGGSYVISEVAAAVQPDERQPMPWENGELVFAQGKRVTVAAAPGQAKHLKSVLAVADQAAAVDDRYAAMVGTPQRRYRIFLAGEKQWKSWYGGDGSAWAIGLAVPLNMRGIDVVLRMREMDDPLVLRVTLQHELGHVVTLSGAYRADAAEDIWLSEGIAEYIGWQPRPATGSLRRSSVRWALDRGNAPKSMVPARPGKGASDRAGDAFYGLSHFAADCMAKKYGEKKLFDFVRLVLTQDNEYDQAARDAYGVPFATVDKFCLSWIKQQAR